MCLSLCAIRRLSSHNSTETFGSHCTIDGMLWLTYKITYRVFLVSFVTIAATGAIFSLQCTKNRLAAGLRPDPLGPAERSPKPPSRKKGPTSKGREGRGGKGIGWERNGREGWERRGQERKEGKREGSWKEGENGKDGEEGGRCPPPNADTWIRPCTAATTVTYI